MSRLILDDQMYLVDRLDSVVYWINLFLAHADIEWGYCLIIRIYYWQAFAVEAICSYLFWRDVNHVVAEMHEKNHGEVNKFVQDTQALLQVIELHSRDWRDGSPE